MSTATERPTLPKGWEWDDDMSAERKLAPRRSLIVWQSFSRRWKWTARLDHGDMLGGEESSASSAAAAAERAVVEWARGLIREIEG